MSIKIEPTNDIHDQRFEDGNKNRWVIKNLISRVKDLQVQEMPIEHLNI